MDLDFNGVSSGGQFEALPEGVYHARVFKLELRTSQANPANKYFNVEVIVQDEAFKGRHLFGRLMLQDNAKWKIKQFIEACGVQIPEDGHFSFVPSEFEGKLLRIKVTQRMYEGTMRNEIKIFLPATEDFEISEEPQFAQTGAFDRSEVPF